MKKLLSLSPESTIYNPGTQKMALSVLHLLILSALSITTHAVVPEACTTAISRFSLNNTCFGTEAALNAFLPAFSSGAAFANPLAALTTSTSSSVRQALNTFFSKFCTQECIQSYVEAFTPCYTAVQQQVSLYVLYIANMYVQYIHENVHVKML